MKSDMLGFNRKTNRILLYIMLLVIILTILFPFYWVFLTSITPQNALGQMSVLYDYSKATFESYKTLFTRYSFGVFIKNSVLAASVTTIICISVSTLAAYAIARLRFRGKRVILYSVLCASMLPMIAILQPIYNFLTNAGLKNTWYGLVIPYMAFGMPLSVWYLSTFFKSIPPGLEEAAKIDGCSHFQCLTKVIAPLALPGIFTASILVFIQAWNEYLISSTVNSEMSARTVPVGIVYFRGEYSIPWVDVCTAIIIVTIPIALLVLVLQRRIVSGLTSGAVKE